MKVGICTLGCKVNTYESEYIINELKKAGCIEKEEWLDDGVHITARATGRLLALCSPFIKN